MVYQKIKQLLLKLKYPNVRNLSYDDTQIIEHMHYNVRHYSFVRKTYEGFYKRFIVAAENVQTGKWVELGSGYGFLKEFLNKVTGNNLIISDIQGHFNLDMKFSAEEIPFDNNSVSAFFMLGVLHHIKNCERMFKDIERTLKPGGRLIMIEPYNNKFAGFMYRISHHEPFCPNAGWNIQGDKAMSCANLALPWIIFERDRKLFGSKFPNLVIKQIELHSPIIFQVSGAGAYNTFLPGFSFHLFKFIELLLKPYNKYLAMWMTIVLEKKVPKH